MSIQHLASSAPIIGVVGSSGTVHPVIPAAPTAYTQLTSATTAVETNTLSGVITLFPVTLGDYKTADGYQFTVTNGFIKTSSMINAFITSASPALAAGASPNVSIVSAPTNGSCIISVKNVGTAAFGAATTLRMGYLINT